MVNGQAFATCYNCIMIIWLKCWSLFPLLPVQLLAMDKESLKKKGMTEGAAKKLVSKIEELK